MTATRPDWGLPLPLPALTDGVVALRPWRDPEDLSVVRAATADPAIPAGTTVPAVYTTGAGRNWIARQNARRLAGTGLVLAVTDLFDPGTDATSVGMVGLTGINPEAASCELGYWLVPAARGRALSGRSAALLVDWAFRTLPLVRIGARIAVDNVASQRSAERAGLRREGVSEASFRVGDAWVDMATYAVIRPGTPRVTWAELQSRAEPPSDST
ncbi:MAG TPA: GNAT family N-acetyltransferase [Mycobacteriales bacterium]